MADIASSFSSPEAFVQGVSAVVWNFVGVMVQFIPNLIVAAIIFVVGYLIAVVLSNILKKALVAVKFEKVLEEHGVEDALGSIKASPLFVKIFKYYVILIFLQAAVAKLDLGTMTQFINMVLLYAPAFIGAAIILVVAALIGELIKEKIKEVDAKSRHINMIARFSKFVVVFFGLVMGLSAVGFDTSILKDSFVAVLQAIAYGVALAIGIAFGLGGQDEAKSLLTDFRKKVGK
ncbi:MAG: hypothetical protein ABH863_02415 [Candidatus Micrarchaeota archaeon]